MNDQREYVAHAFDKRGRLLGKTEPTRNGRDAAVSEAFCRWHDAARVSCGYGYNGGFNIQSTTREQWSEK